MLWARNDPARFELDFEETIRANAKKIIDVDRIESISVRQFKRKFHLGTRKLYQAKVNYSLGTSTKIKCLLIKKVHDALRSFETHMLMFDKFEKSEMRQLLPKPYFIISPGSYVVMDFIQGSSLSNIFFLRSILGTNGSLDKWIRNLGRYLSVFHGFTMSQFEPSSLDDVVLEIIEELEKLDFFSKNETKEIFKHLDKGIALFGQDYKIPRAKLFNDWTLRNFLLDRNKALKLVDIDSMVHPKFPELDIIWNDISSFLINVESKTKYFPFVNRKKIKELELVFLKGYIENLNYRYSSKEIDFLHFIAVLRLYLGMIERTLIEIYHKWPGGRFIKQLRESIVMGSGSIFGKLS
jgi:hypothetical protein